MVGYSGTPLPQKLGIKPQSRVALVAMPAAVNAQLKQALAECEIVERGLLDFVIIFVTAQKDLQKEFSRRARQLAPKGMLWVSWPKKISGVATDLTENEVRRIGLEAGLVDVKVCAVTDVWSGLKFVIPVKDRGKERR
jgi:Protein of unknown function (DUF3052)